MMKSILFIWLLCVGVMQGVEVSATLSANVVPAGQGVLLTVDVVDGALEGAPIFPVVENLVINPRGTSQQTQITNGHISQSVSYTYVVGSNVAGDYEVPAGTVRVDGKDYKTEVLKLKVGGNGDEDLAKEEEPRKYGHLDFKLLRNEKKHLYPGEIAPVRIRAYFPIDAQVSLTSAPRPEGSAFTLHNLSKEPQQNHEVVNGQQCLAVTWFGGLSATKAGEYPASFVLTGTVAVRDDSARRRSVFGSFFGSMEQKDVRFTTDDPALIEVRELPLEGRPDSFTGAIGQFEFESAQIPDSLRTGEPFQVGAVIKGAGNFALLSAPHPSQVEDWKVYEGTGDFISRDVASFSGSKSFNFSVVPLVPGEREIDFVFSYFDPEEGEYREVSTGIEKVEVTGEAVKPVEVAEAATEEESLPEGPQLAPLASELGSVMGYEPFSEKVWFVPVLGGSGVVSLAILGAGWWRGRGVNLVKEAARANELGRREALRAAEEAAGSGDGLAFFTAAKMAIRLGVGRREGLLPEAITLADLGAQEDDRVIEILREADRLEYSREEVSPENLKVWNMKLKECLESLAMKGKGMKKGMKEDMAV